MNELKKIVERFESYVDEVTDMAHRVAYDDGYDEATDKSSELIDEAYNAGNKAGIAEGVKDGDSAYYGRGFNHGIEATLTEITNAINLDASNFFATPESTSQLQGYLRAHSDNGYMCAQMTINYVMKMIKEVSDDHPSL